MSYIQAWFGVTNTGLSATITIYNLSNNSVVVNAAAMTHIANGIYKYNFSTYDYTKEYSIICDGGASLSDNERYKNGNNLEPNSAYLQSSQRGGGMVVQYPGNVINKKDEKFKNNLMELLKVMQAQIKLISKKTSKEDFAQVQKSIEDSITKINKSMLGVKEEQKKNVQDEIDKLIKNGEESNKRYMQSVADFTDNIYQLQEQTKILPNSLNSQLNAARKDTTSKFAEITSNLGKLGNRLNCLQESTSKFSQEEVNNLTKVKEDIHSQVSKLQADIDAQAITLPKFISEKISGLNNDVQGIKEELVGVQGIKEELQNTQKDLQTYEEMYLSKSLFQRIADLREDYKENIEKGQKGIEERIEVLGEQINNSPNTENIKGIKEQIGKIKNNFDEFKSANQKDVRIIKEMIPKLSQKRDLSYTTDQINKTIKEFQSNNTKKVKGLRDSLDQVQKDITVTKKQLKHSKEDADIASQMALINGGE